MGGEAYSDDNNLTPCRVPRNCMSLIKLIKVKLRFPSLVAKWRFLLYLSQWYFVTNYLNIRRQMSEMLYWGKSGLKTQSSQQDSNPGTLEYKAVMLANTPQKSSANTCLICIVIMLNKLKTLSKWWVFGICKQTRINKMSIV